MEWNKNKAEAKVCVIEVKTELLKTEADAGDQIIFISLLFTKNPYSNIVNCFSSFNSRLVFVLVNICFFKMRICRENYIA